MSNNRGLNKGKNDGFL